MSVTIQKERRKRSRKYKIRVRYKHTVYKTIETEDYGTFREMYEKYKGKYEFWCGDYPPEKNHPDGNYTGFRLDSDIDPAHERYTLRRFGRHKAWLDLKYRVDGKPVILVFNAGRYNGKNRKKSNSSFGFLLMVLVVWLVLFVIMLPQIMCNGDIGCTTVDPSNLLYLWWFILTLGGGTVPYLDTVFGIWAAMLVGGVLLLD